MSSLLTTRKSRRTVEAVETLRVTGAQARELDEVVCRLIYGPVQIVCAAGEASEPSEPVDEEHVAALLRLAETLECASEELAGASRRMRESAARLYGLT